MWNVIFKDDEGKIFEIFPFVRCRDAINFWRDKLKDGKVTKRDWERAIVNGRPCLVRIGMDLDDTTESYVSYREDNQ